MDPASGLCTGCFRSLDEIAAWSGYEDAAKLRVLDAVARRRAAQAPCATVTSGNGEEAP